MEPCVKVIIQLCEISSISYMTALSCGSDTEFGYICTVVAIVEIYIWVKVIKNP